MQYHFMNNIKAGECDGKQADMQLVPGTGKRDREYSDR
jgi:hypothetical protein